MTKGNLKIKWLQNMLKLWSVRLKHISHSKGSVVKVTTAERLPRAVSSVFSALLESNSEETALDGVGSAGSNLKGEVCGGRRCVSGERFARAKVELAS